MFVRVGTFQVQPGALAALLQRYRTQCAPTVRATKGNVDCVVLEPVDQDAPVAIATVWRTEADALAYEASGAAADIVDRVREFFVAPPQLRSYRIYRPDSADS